ncbi:30S ribosomal protein S7 [Mycoplasma sp. SG1]|uniref:30S ribosomal protein S7 n=1 Tax=Mycoplasma sp. SG1 TaxID=2810348 RepID=UPI0020254FCC|nr:30S ribosomal protein S7 [Mycoplasma sp. SG1]URM52886.1 30S ribosomal protein S7 [Mycoplasma sp. SG1]
MRKKVVKIRPITPDLVYSSKLITKMINYIIKDGKRHLASKIFYNAMDIVKEKTNQDPILVFNQAVKNAMPQLQLKSRRMGGATYQVPIEVLPRRQIIYALKWIQQEAEKRKTHHTMEENLASEIIDAYHNSGGAVKRKRDVHRRAEENKAFAHFNW